MCAALAFVCRTVNPMVCAGLLLSGVAHAQTPGCEQFKGTLAKRLQSDARGQVVESVPAGDPLPAGTRVVGNCAGGAYKVVIRTGVAAAAPEPKRPALPPAAPNPAPAPSVAASAAVAAAPAPAEIAPVVSGVQETPAAPSPNPGFVTGYGRWLPLLPLLVLLPLIAWGWRWAAHRRLYDKNGLPRGPRF